MMSYAVVRQQIMNPLLAGPNNWKRCGMSDCNNQRLAFAGDAVTIAAAGCRTAEADGAAIFLKRGTVLELAAVHKTCRAVCLAIRSADGARGGWFSGS